MEKLIENLKKLVEGQHHNTKVRNIDVVGSRHIRMGIAEYCKRIEEMMDYNHPSPCPKSEQDRYYLEESLKLGKSMQDFLKKVNEYKRNPNK